MTARARASRPFFSWRWSLLKSDLPPTTRLVLLVLSCHMNDAGESCYPSVKTLAAETGLSRQSVMSHIQLARRAGWVEVVQVLWRGEGWKRNEYRMAWPVDVLANTVKQLDRATVKEVDRGTVKEVDLNSTKNSTKNSTSRRRTDRNG